MTAMPCGQKNSTSEISHSHTVTPPLAAIDGTTFRLKTATTNSSTRSKRPSTRFRCGCSSVVIGSSESRSGRSETQQSPIACRVSVRGNRGSFLLRLRQRRRQVFERRNVLVNVGLGVLHRHCPLFIPPVGLRHHAAVHHSEPVVTPQLGIHFQPVAVVAYLPRRKHQRPVGS